MRICAAALGALLFAFSGLGADFYFLQLSDPQFGMYAADRDFVQETANFEFAIASANRLRPAFVVICGDLINKPGDAAQTAEYLRIAAKLDKAIPLYNVVGNHDVGNEPTAESLAIYRKRFGRDYYTFRHGDFEGFVLNSSLIQHPERAPEEAAKQEKWLATELDRSARQGTKRRVVFQHIPWFLETAGEADQYFNIPIVTRTRYIELFRRFQVEYVFAGHYHRNANGSAPGASRRYNRPGEQATGRGSVGNSRGAGGTAVDREHLLRARQHSKRAGRRRNAEAVIPARISSSFGRKPPAPTNFSQWPATPIHCFQIFENATLFASLLGVRRRRTATAQRRKTMKTKLMILMLLAGSTMFAGSRFYFGVGVGAPVYGPSYVVAPAPPPPPAYYHGRPIARGPGYEWVSGYYYPVGPRYAWRAGYWARPPYARSYWVGPRYYGGRYYHGYWGRR